MVFALAGRNEDRERIQLNVDWLIRARVMDGPTLLGWGYHTAATGSRQKDNSNAQYAVLGLHEGKVAGAKIDRDVWVSIRDFYARTQQVGGSWGYPEGHNGALMTM